MKYCCIDIGNVLVNVDFQRFINKLSKSLNITLEEANYFMNRTQKLHDLGLTKMSDELHDHYSIKSPIIIDELIEEWNGVITPADYIIDILLELMDKHDLKIALLSNIGLEHAEQIVQKLHYNGKFFGNTIQFFSCYVGARKPSLVYYNTFLQLYPEFRGCLYIDDLQENLDASKQFGFKTYRFALDDIIGANYTDDKFNKKIDELKKLILA